MADQSFNIPVSFLSRTTSDVKDHYRKEFGCDYPASVVESALVEWLHVKFDAVLDNVADVLTTPGSREASEFAHILMNTAENSERASDLLTDSVELDPMFAGYRQLAPERISAMIGYLSQRGIVLYKTKLNKLLFYADLTGFYLTGRGLSGAQYVNLPYGPVPDGFEQFIKQAVEEDVIKLTAVSGKAASALLIEPGMNVADAVNELNDDDRRVLDWVVGTYGNFTTAEITEASHNEIAYSNTRSGERIAYRYAAFLKTLPPKDLLEI